MNPWEEYPEIWSTKAKWFSYLRGCLRKAWNTNPIKITVTNERRKQIPNPNPKGKKPTVWGATCECCGNDFVMKDIQVDHMIPAGSLKETSDIQGFVERLLYVKKEDIRLVCKGCHNIITDAERKGISFEEAVVLKRIRDMSIEEQKEVLDKHGLKSNNKKLRDEGLTMLAKEGKI